MRIAMAPPVSASGMMGIPSPDGLAPAPEGQSPELGGIGISWLPTVSYSATPGTLVVGHLGQPGGNI